MNGYKYVRGVNIYTIGFDESDEIDFEKFLDYTRKVVPAEFCKTLHEIFIHKQYSGQEIGYRILYTVVLKAGEFVKEEALG